MILFRGGDYGIDLSIQHMVRQLVDGVWVIFNPAALVERLSHAWSLSQWWLIGVIGPGNRRAVFGVATKGAG